MIIKIVLFFLGLALPFGITSCLGEFVRSGIISYGLVNNLMRPLISPPVFLAALGIIFGGVKLRKHYPNASPIVIGFGLGYTIFVFLVSFFDA